MWAKQCSSLLQVKVFWATELPWGKVAGDKTGPPWELQSSGRKKNPHTGGDIVIGLGVMGG